MVYAMPAIVTRCLTMSYLLTSQWLTESRVSKILDRKHFVYDSELWEGRGPDFIHFHVFWRASLLICILKRILDPKRVLAALFFAWNSSMNQCIVKFSLQYEILNLEVFCKSMELTMLLLLTIYFSPSFQILELFSPIWDS